MNRLILSGLITLTAATTCGCASTSPSSSSSSSPTAVTSATPAAAVSADSAPADSATVAQAPNDILQGSFVSGEHPTSGTVQIVSENGQRFIELGSDFQTDSGPDLFVILHRSSDVIGSTQPPAYSINEADYVEIAPLKATSGTQRYAIPTSVNSADYQSVAIWCRQFNATFGAAHLTTN